MRISNRLTARALVPSVLVAVLTAAGVQAATQSADAAPKKAAAITACTTAHTKVTVSPVTRPINHLLLKATNTGTKPCYAYGAPYLRAGADAQAPLAWDEDSVPQSVVTLAPGKSAYAGIATYTPDGEGGYTAKTLGVLFANRAMNGSAGPEKTLKLPHNGVHFNSAATVGYWQTSIDQALFG
ncbi:DUF4232 domain-containing protein [Streptomyces sp. W16]|uniref:DUF4232 domain-containing protein n=1 Tax=Streptomyces sp. W16 TaxID=3076631 RepID=UPI00295B4688|nr:DUF4232 domain-containing protein [Streptomyces sp. W16]MDV9176180.1 DUF4232 domain-containing protein [Streptomyces sp. W16]